MVTVHSQSVEGGWECEVTVEQGGMQSRHTVSVSAAELARLGRPDSTSPDELVERTFAFLLGREAPEQILPRFSISEVGRFFPDFESVIRT